MQYEPHKVRDWNGLLDRMSASIKRGARIVMTSRDYIYESARTDLKIGAFPLLRESQVVVDVHDLTLEERRQILYNHLRLGEQPRSFLRQIKRHLEGVARNGEFRPEIARRLANPVFTKTLDTSAYGIRRFVEHPVEFLKEVVEGLDAESKSALALIYMSAGRLASPVAIGQREREAIDRIGGTQSGVLRALNSLKGSLVQCVREDGDQYWIFKHPTIGDAFADVVASDVELMNIYLIGADLESLTSQITCGRLDVPGSVVEVPRRSYDLVLQRLNEAGANYESRRDVYWFLAHRCGLEFLKAYVERNPDVIERVSRPGLYLDAVPEVPLALRFIETDIMTPALLQKFKTRLVEHLMA